MKQMMLVGMLLLMSCGAMPDAGDRSKVNQSTSGDGEQAVVSGEVTVQAAEAAITTNDVAGLERLLKAGLDPNAAVSGRYALTDIAAYEPNVELIQLLHKYGASLEMDEGSRRRGPLAEALALAVETGYDENFEYVLSNVKNFSYRSGSPPFTLPESAIALGRYDVANRLLDMGYDRELEKLVALSDSSHVPPASAQAREKAKLLARIVGT